METAYKKFLINEELTVDGEKINGCYVIIKSISISQLSDFVANYQLLVYKTKSDYINKPLSFIVVDEIDNITRVKFTANFNQGEVLDKAISELVYVLLAKNTSWEEENIIIEI